MGETLPHQIFRRLRGFLPAPVAGLLRAAVTALYTPVRFAMATGHLRSSLAGKAMTPAGEPLPWYTYPAIDFLARRSFAGRTVLEFGGGQSTSWWSARADAVVTVEEDADWYRALLAERRPNVEVHHVPADRRVRSIAPLRDLIASFGERRFDIVVIDGHLRAEAVPLAFQMLKPGGAIVLDDADRYRFHAALQAYDCRRVDFYGFAPGVSLRHCTSVVFRDDCFLFAREIPIAAIERS